VVQPGQAAELVLELPGHGGVGRQLRRQDLDGYRTAGLVHGRQHLAEGAQAQGAHLGERGWQLWEVEIGEHRALVRASGPGGP